MSDERQPRQKINPQHKSARETCRTTTSEREHCIC